ncbi:NRDE family protein [Roseivirga sp. UBA838]|uniref:NRDE family protein n=1 Tax=Roseivirga sp. UBA838 TaxID=1947393 RepID=UPI00257AF26D|nr:NRDE family protein [Roseivirga sp. UBA838]|tara:strand:+ start:7415 stop:8104 length:690 start_codon:yes stop_codon:yes gene_type:complete
MCTVTFLPKAKGNFILTSNRDEDPQRASFELSRQTIGGRPVHFPKDPKAGGTWLATDKKRFTLCLLNGGFEKHHHKPPYRLSRGLMVLEFFNQNSVIEFIEHFEFKGIEPFTLIIVEHQKALQLHQLVWDENKLHHNVLQANQPHIWSSSTLYPEDVREERRQWFMQWLERQREKEYDQKQVLHFHKFGGKGDAWNNFVMNRENKVKTVSVTSAEKADGHFELVHESLV